MIENIKFVGLYYIIGNAITPHTKIYFSKVIYSVTFAP